MNSSAIWHELYLQADYSILAILARKYTMAIKLDGRACWYIYEAVLPRIDWQAVSASELFFMRSLGIKVKP